jgi:hypothetical protein
MSTRRPQGRDAANGLYISIDRRGKGFLTFGLGMEGPMARRPCSFTLVLAFVCLAGATSLHAQTTSASVSGTVQDSQGGVLPGATVTLTSRTQGNALTTVTSERGRFVFPINR